MKVFSQAQPPSPSYPMVTRCSRLPSVQELRMSGIRTSPVPSRPCPNPVTLLHLLPWPLAVDSLLLIIRISHSQPLVIRPILVAHRLIINRPLVNSSHLRTSKVSPHSLNHLLATN